MQKFAQNLSDFLKRHGAKLHFVQGENIIISVPGFPFAKSQSNPFCFINLIEISLLQAPNNSLRQLQISVNSHPISKIYCLFVVFAATVLPIISNGDIKMSAIGFILALFFVTYVFPIHAFILQKKSLEHGISLKILATRE